MFELFTFAPCVQPPCDVPCFVRHAVNPFWSRPWESWCSIRIPSSSWFVEIQWSIVTILVWCANWTLFTTVPNFTTTAKTTTFRLQSWWAYGTLSALAADPHALSTQCLPVCFLGRMAQSGSWNGENIVWSKTSWRLHAPQGEVQTFIVVVDDDRRLE